MTTPPDLYGVPPATLLGAVLAGVRDGVLALSPGQVVTVMNAAAGRLLGQDAAQAEGLGLERLLPSDAAQALRRSLQALQAGADPGPTLIGPIEGAMQAKPVVVTAAPLRDEAGAWAGSVLFLRGDGPGTGEPPYRELHYEALINNADDAIVTKTLDGIVRSWNPGAERLFGWTAAEMIGRPMTTVIPLDRHPEEAMILARVAAGQRIEGLETERIRKDGATVLVSATVSPILDRDGRIIGASKVARDIGTRVQAERVIQFQASMDAMTGVLNLRAFTEHLRETLRQASASARPAALLLIDLDRFKLVNDTLGHRLGDHVLRQLARRMKHCLREGDAAARVGGDEFAIVLRDIECERDAMAVADRVVRALSDPLHIEDREIVVGCSVGVALYPDDGANEAALLQHADEAMHGSKRAGGMRASRLSASERQAARDRSVLMADLQIALAQGQLSVAYQPVIDLATGVVQRSEALARWTHPVRGPVSPALFIPLAEEAGLVNAIGDWVFREATRQVHAWRTQTGRPLEVSINLSPTQLHAGAEYFEAWARHVDTLGLDCSAVVFEITESMVVDGTEETARVLNHIRGRGARIAIDDFGTGFSNLSSLSRLDVQFLKIDQSFVQAMTRGPRDLALCEAITTLAHKLGLKVIAEGVESAQQAALLRAMGCDYGQGYLFGRPVAARELFTTLAQTPG